jgi:hypothetical protein
MATEHLTRSMLHLLTGHRPLLATAQSSRKRSAAPIPVRPDWVNHPSIQALGLGEKISGGQQQEIIALKIYVEKKLPLGQLDLPIPKHVSLGDVENIVTDVVEIGKIELHGNVQRLRPALPGFSVSRANDVPNTGTFGMVVRRKGQAIPHYLLSNCHAIAASGLATKGDTIIQPGAADSGVAATDSIGTLTDWVAFDFTPNSSQNTVDCAIAELDPAAASAAIALLGVPVGVNTKLTRGMYVQKVGRTTSHSVARITDTDLVLTPTYPTKTGLQKITLRDQVLVTFYSAPGDSGSGVLDMNNNVVGLHVGGSDVVGFFCKIENIMDRLGVEPVTTAIMPTTS